jgi:tetratricopeptide (TPR) repeat protein
MPPAESSPPSYEEAQALQADGRLEEAVEIFERLATPPLTVKVVRGLGDCLFELGRYDAAETWRSLLARNRPADPAARQALGALYAAQGRVQLAELEFRTALAFDPAHIPSQLGLGALLLSTGAYEAGFPLLDRRGELYPDVVPPVRLSYPEWRGEPLAGRSVLVWVEQGFGDQIQMARFAAVMKARGASRITLACRQPLAHLFSTLEAVDEIMGVELKTSVSVPRHDYWSRYFSLPARLGTTLQDLPARPYLSAPADRRERWRGVHAGGVGLVWEASPTGFNARNKGLPPDAARALLDLGLVSLQPEDTGAVDFADTAAIIEQLDLVISIDTAVAHLAGALGKPCWTLLPALHTDWRWGRQGQTSPWYPTMRLYRQTTPRDWSQVMAQLTADLAAWRSAQLQG